MTELTKDMRRDFTSRDDLIAYLKAEFPDAAAVDDHIAPIRGGRAAADATLEKVDPVNYALSRNKLHGAVTRLSPYLRYGVVTLAEVRKKAFAKISHRRDADTLISELAWRDYWQRLYVQLGNGIWRDQEAYKTGFTPEHYKDALPADLASGDTGLKCIDSFVEQLHTTGYLHNHARLWMAAYLVHWRRIKWQAGARWFLQHLLDGDPASNNLSWQWVASTFSNKPYIFNRENVERNTNAMYCRECPLYGNCDFEGSYERIERDLFPKMPPNYDDSKRPDRPQHTDRQRSRPKPGKRGGR